MRLIFLLLLFGSAGAFAQCKTYSMGANRDTLDCVDTKNLKQGKWVIHHDDLRGEPGFEEEGLFKDDRKENVWRQYDLDGDLIGVEHYKWGNKDSICQYFSRTGELLREEGWRALNPNKLYDTIDVEDLDHLDHYKSVIVKNEGVGVRQGEWRYYDPSSGMIIKTERYTLGKLEAPKASDKMIAASDTTKAVAKPKEVQDFEKKNSGKKKVKYVDGTVNY